MSAFVAQVRVFCTASASTAPGYTAVRAYALGCAPLSRCQAILLTEFASAWHLGCIPPWRTCVEPTPDLENTS